MRNGFIAVVAFLMAAPALRFDITDARGKKPSGVTVETGDADADGWYMLHVTTKANTAPVLVWPFDARAKAADRPGSIPVIVMESGDARALSNAFLVATIAAGDLLGARHATGLDSAAFARALQGLVNSSDPFVKGVALLSSGKAVDAVEPLGLALKERERRLTRVPSEIYVAAMLFGQALSGAGKFDDAAVAFLKAMAQRPSDEAARRKRAAALIGAGKPEAAESLLDR